VNTSHGVLPVPTPATAALLKGCPVYAAGPETELTTPTGAAIITTLAANFGPMPALRILSQGFGAGDKEFLQRANVLRVIVGERNGASEAITVSMIEANIDDSTPQVLGFAVERLLEGGALDVTLTPVIMKKNRPATMISVMAVPETVQKMVDILFAETSTLGLRISHAERRVLARQMSEVETAFGIVHMKYTETGTFAPEYDDCRKAAVLHRVPLRTVIAEANQRFRAKLNQ
jgi:hypothetical protein